MGICFHCQTNLSHAAGQQPTRSDSCEHCGSDVRVCLNCEFYDPSSYNECREPQAERVLDKDKANFCDYFRLSSGTGACNSGASSRGKAMSALESLFKK